MKIDIVTIFPEFFDVLDVSLLGKARQAGLIEVDIHNLRDFTHDRHRTVDDTPYGGGAGMVMRPEPWGEALDSIVQASSVVIFPSPAGERFTQAMAREFALEPKLVFACGRYEGIDQRVVDVASSLARVREVSLGDYVLNGGEVAVLAMIEAVGRLVPGVIGNAASLDEIRAIASRGYDFTDPVTIANAERFIPHPDDPPDVDWDDPYLFVIHEAS